MCRSAAIYFKYVRNERASVCFSKVRYLNKCIYICYISIYLMNHINSLLCKYTIATVYVLYAISAFLYKRTMFINITLFIIYPLFVLLVYLYILISCPVSL